VRSEEYLSTRGLLGDIASSPVFYCRGEENEGCPCNFVVGTVCKYEFPLQLFSFIFFFISVVFALMHSFQRKVLVKIWNRSSVKTGS